MAPSSTTRDRIVRAATGSFRRKGIHGTGVAEICERAGVTKGVFSHHFPGGKNELIVEVVRTNGEDVRALLGTPDPEGPAIPGRAIAAAFAGYAHLLRERGVDFGCPVAASVVDASGASAEVRYAAEAAFESWASAIAAVVDGDGDLGLLVVAALEGAILLARANADPTVLDRVGSALTRLLDPDRPTPVDPREPRRAGRRMDIG
jgi:TetR/AcrR family transcriptional regulator, lmrAB and yxaGH operons repressor